MLNESEYLKKCYMWVNKGYLKNKCIKMTQEDGDRLLIYKAFIFYK